MEGPELGERLPLVSDVERDTGTGLVVRLTAKGGEETEEKADIDDDVIVAVEALLRGISTGGLPNGEPEKYNVVT